MRGAFMLRLDGRLAGNEIGSTFVNKDEGLSNPAAPAYGPGSASLNVDIGRTFKGHQFLYSRQTANQRSTLPMGFAARDAGSNRAGWAFTPWRLARIQLSRSRSREAQGGRGEAEDQLVIAVSRSIRRLSASVTCNRTGRMELPSTRLLWSREVMSGDASLDLAKGRRVHLRYEANETRLRAAGQRISNSVLQADAQLNFGGEKVSVSPGFALGRQSGTLPSFDLSTTRLAIAAALRLPRWIPGVGLFINLGTHRAATAAGVKSGSTDLIFLWKFKRI
jgi:hypothetical protein